MDIEHRRSVTDTRIPNYWDKFLMPPLCSTRPTWTALGGNPFLLSVKPTANRLSHAKQWLCARI